LSFAVKYDRLAAQTIEPNWPARAMARLRAHRLDRELIAGADPAQSPELAARAGWLTSSDNRASLAGAIERLVRSAYEGPNRWGVSPQRTAVIRQADELWALASLLRGRSPLYARGLAMLGRLVADGTGPAYVGQPEALVTRIREARSALAG
jgi:hypothetical protein